jgi:Domain of unknown function (DUF4159)
VQVRARNSIWLRATALVSGALGLAAVAGAVGVLLPRLEGREGKTRRRAAQPSILSLPDALTGVQQDALGDALSRSPAPRQFYFTRGAYTGYYRFRDFMSWTVDYPKADRQFLIGVRRLTNLDAYELENPVRLTDPNLDRYPFLYFVEPGYMALTEGEVESLRRYLKAGGFLVVDDFWGTFEWENFQSQIQRVLPGYAIVDIPLSHPIFSCFYDVKEILQVPNVGQGIQGGPTWEQDGYYPAVKGIFDEKGRLMVVINWNTDLGDAWEWAENPYYPLKFSTYAYQMGVNYIIYAMSH